jgi:CspA family cold shock protein
MKKGTIRRVVADRGFGFIQGETGEDLFFHRSACQGVLFESLREGQSVEYEAGQGPKGPRATSVRLASKAGGTSSA